MAKSISCNQGSAANFINFSNIFLNFLHLTPLYLILRSRHVSFVLKRTPIQNRISRNYSLTLIPQEAHSPKHDMAASIGTSNTPTRKSAVKPRVTVSLGYNYTVNALSIFLFNIRRMCIYVVYRRYIWDASMYIYMKQSDTLFQARIVLSKSCQ